MPIIKLPGGRFKFGAHGKVYSGPKARARARAQGQAISISKIKNKLKGGFK